MLIHKLGIVNDESCLMHESVEMIDASPEMLHKITQHLAYNLRIGAMHTSFPFVITNPPHSSFLQTMSDNCKLTIITI